MKVLVNISEKRYLKIIAMIGSIIEFIFGIIIIGYTCFLIYNGNIVIEKTTLLYVIFTFLLAIAIIAQGYLIVFIINEISKIPLKEALSVLAAKKIFDFSKRGYEEIKASQGIPGFPHPSQPEGKIEQAKVLLKLLQETLLENEPKGLMIPEANTSGKDR